jgi:lysophospholipase L1-like esterase
MRPSFLMTEPQIPAPETLSPVTIKVRVAALRNTRHSGYFHHSRLILFALLWTLGLSFTIQAQKPEIPPACSKLESSNPLNMLVLGDSIMWGQGLLEKHKFSYLVQDWLCQKTNRRVEITREAHSGATIKADGASCPKAEGEVNISRPTILDQVESALSFYGDGSKVDLVLVDGCANDINFRNIVDPEMTKDRLTKLVGSTCGERGSELLDSVTRAFPKAWVIVTGYYPVITERTAKNLITRLLIRIFQKETAAYKFSILKNDRAKFAHLADMSRHWQRESSGRILDNIIKVNQRLRDSGDEARVWYAEPLSFSPQSGFSAPKSLLWTSGFNSTGRAFLAKFLKVIMLGLKNFQPNDEVFSLRQESCQKAAQECPGEFQGSPEQSEKERKRVARMNRLQCEYAAFGHPNREGARRYAEGITRRIDYLIKNIGWLRETVNRPARLD